MIESTLDSGGVNLHYLDWSGSGRPMLLLAGLGDTAHLYRGLGSRLARYFRVVALTRRGHGRSERPASGYHLDTLVEDIRRCLDALSIERVILVGHSFGGLEMPRFALRYPQRVAAIVYLDALFPRLDPEPDLSGDPVPALLPGRPGASDLVSTETYLAYYKRARPDWARIWCEAIEADVLDRVTPQAGGHLEFHHDDELMNRIYRAEWSSRRPDYARVEAPMLALVPDGDFHPITPLDAPSEVQCAADRYWRGVLRPWIRARTAAFQQAVPAAQVVELDTPYHHLFMSNEEETLEAIVAFLGRW